MLVLLHKWSDRKYLTKVTGKNQLREKSIHSGHLVLWFEKKKEEVYEKKDFGGIDGSYDGSRTVGRMWIIRQGFIKRFIQGL